MRMTALEQKSRQHLSELVKQYVTAENNYEYLVAIVKHINRLEENRLGYWNYAITRCISFLFQEGELNTGCRDFYKVIELLERLKFELLTASAFPHRQSMRRMEGAGSKKLSDLARMIRFSTTPPNCMKHEDKEYIVGVLETVKQKFFRKVVYRYEDSKENE